MKTVAVYRDFFAMQPEVFYPPEGMSLADMAKRVKSLPSGWPRHDGDAICINGHSVPRGLWHMVKPKPQAGSVPIEVTLHAPPMGGGGDSKNILALVASIGLVVLSGAVVSGQLFGGLAGKIAGGLGIKAATASQLLGAGVGLLASSALSALSPSPVSEISTPDAPQELGAAGAEGNPLQPNMPLWRVVGTRRLALPLVTQPLVYFEGQDEIVEVVGALAGPHTLTEPRMGGASLDDVDGVQYETVTGWAGYTPLTLFNRYGRSDSIRSELIGHSVDSDNGRKIEIPEGGELADALPQRKMIATGRNPDEVWIDLVFPQGLFNQGNEGVEYRVALRPRIRLRGEETWVDLPELHYLSSQIGEKRFSLHLIWTEGELGDGYVAGEFGWVEARILSPGQTATPTTDDWEADSFFDAGSGDDYISAGNRDSSAVENVILTEHKAMIYLDKTTFPKGEYEIDIKRSYAFRNNDYNAATYNVAAVTRDLFGYQGGGNPTIYQTRKGISDKLYMVRASSVWSDPPAPKGHAALLAIKARNVNLDPITVLASGLVRDWDGSAWTDWATTSNPAAHIRDIYGGTLNALPVPEEIIDDPGLVQFRADCTSMGYEVNAVLKDASVAGAAQICAGAAYAKTYQSDVFGVSRDYDRSAEDPVQYFSPRNMANFSWSKGYPKRPDGLRVTFFDKDQEYKQRQITHPEGAGLTEQITYEGLVTEAEVRARAQYDLDVLKYRTAFYSWEAPALAIKCRRGSLVGVSTDFLLKWAGSGRITAIEYDGSGDVTAITLDNEPTLLGGDDWADLDTFADDFDLGRIGEKSGAVLKRAGGVVTTHELSSTSEGARLVFASAVTPNGLAVGDHVIVGDLGNEIRRLIVLDMIPRDRLTWTITAVAEAPELWEGLLGSYAVGGFVPRIVGDFSVGKYFSPKATDFNSVFTFSRTGPARYFDNTGGLRVAADGVARTDAHYWDGTRWKRGLQIESAAQTNLITYSEDFSNAYWSKVRSNVTSNVAVAPDGTLTGDKLYLDNTAASTHNAASDPIPVVSGTDYEFSLFSRAAEYGTLVIRIGENGNEGTNNILVDVHTDGTQGAAVTNGTTVVVLDVVSVPCSDGWYWHRFVVRLSVTSVRVRIFLRDASGINIDGDGVSGTYIWGAQLAAGQSSYIPTSGSTATRNAEALTIDSSRLPYSPDAMSFAIKGRMSYIDDDTTEDQFLQWEFNGSNRIEWFLRFAGGIDGSVRFAQAAGTDGLGTINSANDAYSQGVDVPFSLAARHGAAFINGAVNGALLTEDNSTSALPDLSETDLELANDFNGFIEEFRMWPEDIADAGIEAASAIT